MFKRNISVDCDYCGNGYLLENREHCVCKKYGVVMRRFKCKKFDYNPLQRQPSRHVVPSADDNDFI